MAGLFVESDDVLEVNTVESEDHQVLEQNRRGRRAAIMAATQIVPFPKDFGGRGVEAGGAIAAEVDIYAARLDRGRGRGVTIDVVAQRLRRIAMEYLFVETNFSGFGVH